MTTVLKSATYPLHWIAVQDDTPYLVPSHFGGWQKRRQLAAIPADANPPAACFLTAASPVRQLVGIPA